ncbi:protein GDAP2 homolog [Selaginella moellendorffii]|nr:protein GDAP2 homolog [Selaginella moellendorffii]|eukprot:XP_002968258.2 protein GDAP2 homolog [Selaginella moellendorffii]
MFNIPACNLIGEEPLAMTGWVLRHINEGQAPASPRKGEKTSCMEPTSEEAAEFDKLDFLKLDGVDRQGRRIVRIVGKFFPAAAFSKDKLHAYILHKLKFLSVEAGGPSFVVVYFHTGVENSVNNPGLLTLRWLYESLPPESKHGIDAIYFVHPGLQSRLLLATLGRMFLSEGFYAKVNYVPRIEFMWSYIDSDQLEVPEFAWEYDDNLECRPYFDYGSASEDLRHVPHIGHPHCVT